MIHSESRTLDWIKSVKANYPILDTQLIEKTIRAFCLLEALTRSGCPFVFKGGTSCMLHLNSERRLSIDIDIICPPGTDISRYLMIYGEEYGFISSELVERKSAHNVPKSHAKFFYQVSYVANKVTDAILLDVLFEDVYYGKIEKLPIKSPFIKTEGEDVMVNVPSAADILGDKLTAFAPHTTGVPFFKGERNCSMEIIKQLFDVASLMDVVTDFQQTYDTFKKFAKVELNYRELSDKNESDILKDAIETALCLTLRGQINPDEFENLQLGVKSIKSFIHCDKYNIEIAIRDAAKAAYMAVCVLNNISTVRRFDIDNIQEIKSMHITHINTKLNKLKKSNVEAFYYWALVDGIYHSERSSTSCC